MCPTHATPDSLADPDQRRRFILDLVRRRVQPGSGSTITFLQTRTWSEPAVDLHQVRTPYVVVGAVATSLYMPERFTHDLDLLVLTRDAPSLHAELRAAGFTRVGTLMIGGSSWQTPSGMLDVIASDESWAEEAIAQPMRSPTGLPIIALPYLILMKLRASRSIDIGDMTRMLGLADAPARQQVLDLIRRYRPDAIEDVESMIALGELELQRPERIADP